MINYKSLISYMSFVIIIYAFVLYDFDSIHRMHESMTYESNFTCMEIRGEIIGSYVDYNNKGFYTYEVKNGKDTLKLFNFYMSFPMKQYLEIGDTIYKPNGKIEYYIFKKDTNLMLCVRKYKILP